jgi:archaellum component FlaC
MTPYEMEEQLKNLDTRTKMIEQILPTLATKDDLKVLATKQELREAVAKLATKADVEDARRYALMLNEATRGDIQLLAEHMATKGDLQELKDDLRGVKDDLRGVKDDMRGMKGDIRGMKDDIRVIAEQVATLSTRRRR